jgi:hypothetical protein
MANAKTKTARVVKVRKKQIGKSNYKRDKSRKALKPGKRISRNKKTYYESRRNRSDKKKGLMKRTFKKK